MLVKVILVGLASWRLTAMLSYEAGPFRIFQRIREGLGFDHDSGGKPTSWPSGFLPSLLACPWCLGVFVVPTFWGLWEVERALVAIVAAMTVLVVAERWNHG